MFSVRMESLEGHDLAQATIHDASAPVVYALYSITCSIFVCSISKLVRKKS